MANLLSGIQLNHSFSGRQVLKDLSMGIHEGERIGVLGPNGAGKSTLIKILTRKLTPDSGKVVWQNGLRVAYLDQSPAFAEGHSIIEVLLAAAGDDDPYPKAYEWLGRMELTQFPEEMAASKLSGGWQKRLALACELMNDPDVLFLDEPTNHLDVESILWLEDLINNFKPKSAVVVITHDRLFLQRTTNRIWDLDPKLSQSLHVFEHGYNLYLEQKEQLLSAEESRRQVLSNTLRRETEWLRRGAQARQTKQKARQESAYELKDDLAELEGRLRSRQGLMEFKSTERGPKKLIEAIGLSLKIGDKTLLTDFSTLITQKTRLGLLGPNGIGKSSLIRCLIGELKPDSGSLKIADNLKVAYFEQSRRELKLDESLFKNICPDGDYVQLHGKPMHARSYLEKFRFRSQQMDLPVKQLSGGEKARLRLAQLMLSEAQLLILDEPTNDLDIETLDLLEDTLREFQGGVILVTHDRYFLDAVSNEIICLPEQLKFSDYFQWEQWRSLKTELQIKETKKSQDKASAPTKKKLSFKEQFELENMEKKLADLETSLGLLHKEVSRPDTMSDSAKLTALTRQISETEKAIEVAFERWQQLEARSKT